MEEFRVADWAGRWDVIGTRRVEVKGVAGSRLSILLTRNELRSAREDESGELAVVTQALTRPQLHIHPAAEVIASAIGYVYQVDLADCSAQ
ncbi:MAG: DUF3883 domain-containing protein [Rhodococcus sp. (in: high G+C Gram-positive bacteria)]|uniref:protein NO VEIN domain-containing protein n=1 Tax=Rhodococcus sp. TaxID=1831 RepID=UPI003BB7A55B